MALTKSIDAYGVSFPEAYIVVVRVEYDKGLNLPIDPSTRPANGYMDIHTYSNKASRDSDSEPLSSERIFFDVDTQINIDPVTQAYNYLIENESYSDAETI